MFSRHFLGISDRICIPALEGFGDNNPKVGRGLNADPSACHPWNWDKALESALLCLPEHPCPPHLPLSWLSELLRASSASPEHPGLPGGVSGGFSAPPHPAESQDMEPAPKAPVPPPPSRPSPRAPHERPVVIFTLRSPALLTTHVWLWPPPGNNIWARTSGGHSSRPPRAAAAAPPAGDGSHPSA